MSKTDSFLLETPIRKNEELYGECVVTNAGDIAFKCNFAYLNENTNIIERRRVDREFDKWGIELCDVINEL